MTDSIVDINGNVPVTPFLEFTDSIFAELSSPYNEWNGYSGGVSFCVDNLDSWKKTLIPLVARLYKLTQTDDMVYWWLLQLMSQVDICKDRKEDFRKKDVFDVLSQLNLKHRTIILENTVQSHVEELQKALDENAFDAFRSMLPIIDDDETIYKIGRVLKRATDVRDIYERTMTHTEGDALGILFVLFRRYYYYFADAYKENHRACDGMAKNVFLALYQTQYRDNKINFCDIAANIGNLWVRCLILAEHNHNAQMPLAVRELLSYVLQGQNTSDKHGELYDELDKYDTEEQKERLIEKHGGWLKLEKYGFVYRFLKEEHIKIKPPFSCKCTDVRHLRRVRRPAQRFGDVERPVQDNCVPYIDSNNAIPMEYLETLKAQEANKNVEIQEPVAVPNYDPEPAVKGKGHGVKDKNKELVLKPIPFPNTLDIAPATPKLFLEVLHSKLVSLADDSVNDFIFILGGVEVDSNGTHNAVDWKVDIRADLQAFCSAFYDMKNLPPRKKPWAKLSKLFTLAGKPIPKLSEDANEVYGKDNEHWMKKRIQSAIDDAKKKALDSPQE